MKYYNIGTDKDPVITGCRSGSYTVEIKNKYSFASAEDKKIWEDYCTQNRNNRSRILWDDFVRFDPALLSNPLTFFPVGKRIKQLDFMAYCPHVDGIHFLITQRTYNIISKYNLPIHNKVPSKIDTFDQDYYLIGFPMLEKSYFDFNKSTFITYPGGDKVIFKNEESYNQKREKVYFIDPEVVTLKEKLNFDIIKIVGSIFLFFSSDIIEEFEKEKITGYAIERGILEN